MKSMHLIKSLTIQIAVMFLLVFSSCDLMIEEPLQPQPPETEIPVETPVAVNPFPSEEVNSAPFSTDNFSDADPLNLNGPVSFFKIMESTKGEFVSVGSDGNILRWGNDNSLHQVWAIYPVTDSKDEKKYRIQSLANKEFMSVGSNGNILRWGYLDSDAQLFDLKKTSNGKLTIIEGTLGQNVAVGWDGNIIRWQASGGPEQEFSLIPYDLKAMPAGAKIGLGETAFRANRIPQPAGIDSADSHVEFVEGDKYLVSEDLMPATLVDDPKFATKIDQINSSPYYYLVRRQYYRPNRTTVSPGEIKSEFEEMDYSFSSSQITQISQKVTWGLEASVSAAYKSATASLKASYENSKEYLQRSEQNTSKSYKITRTVELHSPATIDFTIVVWQLMNEYTLYDADGNVVPSASWTDEETTYQMSFPALPFQIIE